MRNNLTRRLCIGGVIAALYAVLTLALPFLSYGAVQIRFSEALTVLPFFLPEAVPGLAIGCFIANRRHCRHPAGRPVDVQAEAPLAGSHAPGAVQHGHRRRGDRLV